MCHDIVSLFVCVCEREIERDLLLRHEFFFFFVIGRIMGHPPFMEVVNFHSFDDNAFNHDYFSAVCYYCE